MLEEEFGALGLCISLKGEEIGEGEYSLEEEEEDSGAEDERVAWRSCGGCVLSFMLGAFLRVSLFGIVSSFQASSSLFWGSTSFNPLRNTIPCRECGG